MASPGAPGPLGDYAENWAALLDLFISSAGLKLRLHMVDTVLMKSGRVLGHYYTNRDGCVSRFSAHEITRQAIYQRFATLHVLDPHINPFGYIAVAHYSTGVSRLLKRPELQDLVATICGPYEFADPQSTAPPPDNLFCIQSFVVPQKDMRYISAYDVQEGPLCTVLARRFSARYTHAFDDPGSLIPEPLSDSDEPASSARPLSARPGSAASGPHGGSDGPVPSTLTAEELLVESQLVAMGLLEPRRASSSSGRAGQGPGREADEEAGVVEDSGEDVSAYGQPDGISSSLPAPRRVRDDVTKLLQAVASFVERAHGQRILGLVAEFLVAAGQGQGGGQLHLMAVHAVQLDHRASRGRMGTFTERWTDYLEGLAPAPAPQAPGRKHQSPSILRSGDASLVMTERNSGMLVRTAPPTAFDRLSLTSPAPSPGRSVLTPGSVSGAGYTSPHSSRPPTTPTGASGGAVTRIYSATPSAAHHRAVAAMDFDPLNRPGSAPAAVIKVGRHVANSVHSSAVNGHYTLRNAMSAARAGGGGNPTAAPGAPDSYSLWLAREGSPHDSITARLALEVEVLRERLQRQTDIATRAESALQQLAVSSSRETGELRQQVEELRVELGRNSEARRNLAAEYERLRTERLGLQSGRSELSNEVEALRGALAEERETLARAVREASSREEQLENQLKAAQAERDEAVGSMSGLRRRLEEESEVVEALRGQLYDYKQLTTQLQAQVRRGRNNKQLLQSVVGMGLPSTMASTTNLGGTLGAAAAAAAAGSGGGGGGAAGASPGGTKGGDDSDAEESGGGGGASGPDGAVMSSSGAVGSALHGRKPPLGGGAGAGGGGGAPGVRSSPLGQQQHRAPLSSVDRSGTFAFRDDPSVMGPNPHRVTSSGAADNRALSAPRSSRQAGGGVHPLSSPSPSADLSTLAFASLLTDIRTRRLGPAATAANPLTVDRFDGSEARTPTVPASPTGSTSKHHYTPSQSPQPYQQGRQQVVGLRKQYQPAPSGPPISAQGVTLGARKPNYDSIAVHDLFLMSWMREPLTPRMLEYHTTVVQSVAAEEDQLAEIFNFYAQLGRVVWLDEKLTLNEKQFVKLAGETGCSESSCEDAREVFRKLSDKTEFGSEAAANHPRAFIFFEQFPEGVIRLAALRYEWRPPENMEDAEEELYFAAPPFMPPTHGQPAAGTATVTVSAGGTPSTGAAPPSAPGTAHADESPPRPPETVFAQIVRTYLKEDLLPKARRFKTAGSARARVQSGKRTAPKGLWVSGKSLTAGA